ncbi:PxKF domain-containing protein [Thermus thermamylovorans]|uniref:HYR domain-containing protein n=1 Tax=Thermus thermamylovorans TaxID=2509362 RepID=A0A4Q9B5R6_9DEIN|nr:PxKF domain-containing protein [Thermus thermamylovorans]TBH20963.1 HYR domain-containing protein [Thermus thermamylovorans]
MKPYAKALIGGLALLLFAACSGPQGEVGPQEIVVTEGIPAPSAKGVAVRPQGNLEGQLASLVGSQTTPLAVDGCAYGAPSTVQVSYAIKTPPAQAYPASFKVYTTWAHEAGAWVGSDEATVTFQSASDQPKTVMLTVRNGGSPATGTSTFTVEPRDPQPSSGPGRLQTPPGQSEVTVHVSFNPCPATDPPPPNTPPTLTVPNFVLAEATGPAGAQVAFSVTATDLEDGDLTGSVVCTPTSGTLFPIGETTVTCSVTDSGGLSASASFPVYVEDSTPPIFSGVPSGTATRIAQNIQGWALNLADLGISASDPNGVSEPVTMTCIPAEGSYIPIGATQTVVCTARDSATYRAPVSPAPPTPNESQASFQVFVTLNVNPAGFLPPLRMAVPYSAHKRGSTIPHKFYPPTYADGTPATDLADGLRLVLRYTGSCNSTSGEAIEGNDYPTGSTAWRYDPDSGQYVFNLKTQAGWSLGCYRTTVSYAGIPLAETHFSLIR